MKIEEFISHLPSEVISGYDITLANSVYRDLFTFSPQAATDISDVLPALKFCGRGCADDPGSRESHLLDRIAYFMEHFLHRQRESEPAHFLAHRRISSAPSVGILSDHIAWRAVSDPVLRTFRA